jgi:hypothetical protein
MRVFGRSLETVCALHSTNAMHAMPTSPRTSGGDDARPREDADFSQRVLYRWFVEYNPLYLLSAALVLAGCFLLSRGLAHEEGFAATLGIALVSEVYACCLLGGAALLTRIGQPRPAVILALLALLYQWDLSLHTETCAYLGAAGTWAAVAWLATFAAKLYAAGWALRVRFTNRVLVAAGIAAVGLVLGPRIVSEVGGRSAGALLAGWCFALGALHGAGGGIESLVERTPWGQTVLRRTTRMAWHLSAALLAVHVLFLASEHTISLSTALPVAPLLFVRRMRSEGRAWAVILATLAVVAVLSPSGFAITALLAAAALVLRALSPTFPAEAQPSPRAEGARSQPYRVSDEKVRTPAPVNVDAGVGAVGPAERARAFAGATFALYLSAWTMSWSGGAWPAHMAGLDAAITAVALLGVWRLGSRTPLAPLAAIYAHLALERQLVHLPATPVQWGATFVTIGFALLAGSIATSYRLRALPAGAHGDARTRPRSEETRPPGH